MMPSLPTHIGTYDFELGAKREKAIVVAADRYGPSNRIKRTRCSCPVCTKENVQNDVIRELEYKKLEAARDVDLAPDEVHKIDDAVDGWDAW